MIYDTYFERVFGVVGLRLVRVQTKRGSLFMIMRSSTWEKIGHEVIEFLIDKK